ncbi:hypothetical protein [Streptomyces sp. NPDC001450]
MRPSPQLPTIQGEFLVRQGDAAAKASVPADGAACFTFTADAPGLHLVSLKDDSRVLYAQVTAADGNQLDCYDTEYRVEGWCDLPSAGTSPPG